MSKKALPIFVAVPLILLLAFAISGQENPVYNLTITDAGNGYLSGHWFREVSIYAYDPESGVRAPEPIAVFSPASNPIEIAVPLGHYEVLGYVWYDPSAIALGQVEAQEGQLVVLDIVSISVPMDPIEY